MMNASARRAAPAVIALTVAIAAAVALVHMVRWPAARDVRLAAAGSPRAAAERQPLASDSRAAGPAGTFAARLVAAAMEQTRHTVVYDPSYVRLPYPGGDVPADRGVCADVIVRAYRAVGIDLQKEVHEDMRGHFAAYPKLWGLTRPDPNIDHRRVPNLMTFFSRAGAAVPVSDAPSDYRPGDVVAWDLGRGLKHIGLVVAGRATDSGPPLVVHNIGPGPKAADVLFAWPIIGHYRYPGAGAAVTDVGR